MTPGRTLAASILAEVESGRRLDVAWEASSAASSPERPWIRNLVYGTVRLRGRIDHLLARFTARPPAEFDPPVRIALRMGAYQILEMGGVPDYAAVSQAVSQVKGTRSRAAAGLVNAVLRKVAEHGRDRSHFPAPATDLEGYLTTWGSHPGWLVRRWIRALGPEAARALVEANNREPDIYLRPVGVRRSEAVRLLAAAGICPEGSDDEDAVGRCIRLRPRANPASALALVPGVIQDPAASLVADYAAPDPGSLAADLCAAPGGKALALSETAAAVVAGDLSPRRLARVAEGAARRGARVWPVAADARFPPVREAATVLVDAPCTGTGTFRRHPDGRWRVAAADIGKLAEVQRAILDGAASVVPRGGLLVYATCTLEPEENRCQVESFLVRHPGFRIDPGSGTANFLDGKGCLRVLPHESGFDGAFAARLRRTD
ncbi:MAG: hypothetical protein F4X60_12825 [Gemmatimonadetes bacterium]|nr:hypothetical protein [Gemmatimonadota bacterium]